MITQELHEGLQRLKASTQLPQPGWAWAFSHAAWRRIVGQICAVGSSRSWEALDAPGVWEELSVRRIRQEEGAAPQYVHRVLARLRVRYCSPAKGTSARADAIAANAASAIVADAEGRVHLLEGLRSEVGEPLEDGQFSHPQACAARSLLVGRLRFFGPKSASDFLLGLGLADSLLAFDVRLLNLMINHLGWNSSCRGEVGNLRRYEQLEAEVTQALCQPLGITPLHLDRLIDFCDRFRNTKRRRFFW